MATETPDSPDKGPVIPVETLIQDPGKAQRLETVTKQYRQAIDELTKKK